MMPPSGGGGGSSTTENTPWEVQQPFLEDIFSSASALYDKGDLGAIGGESGATNLARGLTAGRALSPNLTGNASALANATLGGGFLDMQNPYLQDAITYAQQPVIDAFNEQVAPGIDATFATTAGGLGSGAYAAARNRAEDTLTRNLAGAATQVGFENFGDERGRQQQMIGLAPGLDQAGYADIDRLAGIGRQLDTRGQLLAEQPYGALQQYAGLINSVPVFGTSRTDSNQGGGGFGLTEGIGTALMMASLFGGGGFGAGSCFAADTPITMADGGTKPAGDIVLGDRTKGGIVNLIAQALSNDWYDYEGVEVTGSHAVKEDGKWLRVESSERARMLGKAQVSHTFNTTDHRIFINGIEFADFVEQDSDHPLEADYFEASLDALNSENGLGLMGGQNVS